MPNNTIPELNLNELIPEHIQILGAGLQMETQTMPEVGRSPVFDVRNLGWENISTPVINNVDQALIDAKLNWTVLPRPVFVDGVPVAGRVANVRSDLPPGQNVLDIVGSKYTIIQNRAALQFVQNIIESGAVRLENAGMFNGGKSIFLLASTAGLSINGERIAPYVIFTNSHDGSGKVKAALTTIRVSCRNTLALALRTAPRVWAVTHTKSAVDHMKAASESMNFIGKYLAEYPSYVEHLMETSVSEPRFAEIANRLFPVPVATGRNNTAVTNAKAERAIFEQVYNDTPDLRAWHGTAWGVLGAYTDYASHSEPGRVTRGFEQNRFARNAINGIDTQRAQAVIMQVATGATA